MSVYYDIESLSARNLRGVALTIGNFDGFHLGHQKLIESVVQYSHTHNVPSVLMTFDPHPVQVLKPEKKMKRIFPVADLIEQALARGIQDILLQPFSRNFSELSPEAFFYRFIQRPYSPSKLVVGYDFTFGANRQGNTDFLKEMALSQGIELEVIPAVKVGGEVVSSSRIRRAIACGNIAETNLLLGRKFYIEGFVVKGAGRGKGLGFPTANLRVEGESVPARGVYWGSAVVDGLSYNALVNIGFNPTFVNSEELQIEVHILDFSSNIYGEKIQFEFLGRLRDEKKFSSVQELIAQIQLDITTVRTLRA